MKTLATIAVLLIIAVAGWQVYQHFNGGVVVETAAVEYGPISEFIEEQGKTRLPETHLVTMPYAGRIEAIELAEGAPVKAGQVVARIVPRDLDLELEAAKAAVARLDAAIRENNDTSVENTGLQQSLSYVTSMDLAVEAAGHRVKAGEAKYELARNTLSRLRTANERQPRSISQEELERAEVAVVQSNVDYQQDILVHRSLEALQAATALLPTAIRQYIGRKDLSRAVLEEERAQAEAQLRQVENNIRRGTMTSPVDGVVLDRPIYHERHLAAGTVLLEIGRLEELEIEADLLSQDVVNVELGDMVEIYGPAIGPQAAHGSVSRIYPAGFTKVSSLGVEEQRVRVVLSVDAGELQRLRDERDLGVGYRVHVRIFTDTASHALLIPRSALFRGARGDWQVFSVRDGRARLQTIQVGLMNDRLVQVAAGLSEHDLVVLAPETNLQDQTRVKPASNAPSAEP
jgi:HlyD family secretion protein